MKRHPDLIQYSREHHLALVLGKNAQALSVDTAAGWVHDFCEVWRQELAPHFAHEEQHLLPRLERAGQGAMVARVLDEHRRLRQLAEGLLAGQAAQAAEFGALLIQHVRFEEREVFAVYESGADESAPRSP